MDEETLRIERIVDDAFNAGVVCALTEKYLTDAAATAYRRARLLEARAAAMSGAGDGISEIRDLESAAKALHAALIACVEDIAAWQAWYGERTDSMAVLEIARAALEGER